MFVCLISILHEIYDILGQPFRLMRTQNAFVYYSEGIEIMDTEFPYLDVQNVDGNCMSKPTSNKLKKNKRKFETLSTGRSIVPTLVCFY